MLTNISPQGVIVTCKQCTLDGVIELSKGSFELSGSDNLVNDAENTIDFFENGTVEIIANGLVAEFELGVNVTAAQNLLKLEMDLPSIPLSPFTVSPIR
jgi:hypothetical protein